LLTPACKQTCHYLFIATFFASLFVFDGQSQSQTVATESPRLAAPCNPGSATISCAPNSDPIDALLDNSVDRRMYADAMQLFGGPSGADPIPEIMQGAFATSRLATQSAISGYDPTKSKAFPDSVPAPGEPVGNQPNPFGLSPGQRLEAPPIAVALPFTNADEGDPTPLLLRERMLSRAHTRQLQERESRQARELLSSQHRQCALRQLSDLECRLAATNRDLLTVHQSSVRPSRPQRPQRRNLLDH
jgi:hypothetical protein